MVTLSDAGGGGEETTRRDGVYTRRNVSTPGEVLFKKSQQSICTRLISLVWYNHDFICTFDDNRVYFW